jgi:deoxyribose-phosphate aldolase
MNYPIKRISELTKADVAGICDHTFLARPESYIKEGKENGRGAVRVWEEKFNSFLDETKSMLNKPYAICVRPENVFVAKNKAGKNIVVASVIGFPNSQSYLLSYQLSETDLAMNHGADEIDMVLRDDLVQGGKYKEAFRIVDRLTKKVHEGKCLIKLILETCELTSRQIRECSIRAEDLGVDFIKTSTGFGKFGAKVKDLEIMAKNFSRGIKISGGINKENYLALIATASRRNDGMVELNPMKIRIGESSLLNRL